MIYLKSQKTLTRTGRKWIASKGQERKYLGLEEGEIFIDYTVRQDRELEMEHLIQDHGYKFYILFSDNPDLIVAQTLTEAKGIADEKEKGEHIVVGCFMNQAKALRYKRILMREMENGLPFDEKIVQERLDQLLQEEEED